MVDYICLECEEELEHKTDCVKHNLEYKHSKFSIKGTETTLYIKLE
jgi:hypothetical protein